MDVRNYGPGKHRAGYAQDAKVCLVPKCDATYTVAAEIHSVTRHVLGAEK